MSTHSVYCYGYYNGSESTVSYIIFKDKEFLEEKVIRDIARSNMAQQILSIKYAVDRLLEIKAENVIINFSSKESNDRIMKAYKHFVVKKDRGLNDTFSKSNIAKIAMSIKSFKICKLNVIPKCDNLRASFLSRKHMIDKWQHKYFMWKDNYPVNNV